MKKTYNKSFKVEITANMIAEKMVTSLDPTLSDIRKEAFVDCIIGPMCSNDNTNGLMHLYYGLFELDMDAPIYKESDDLLCNQSHYTYVAKQKAGENDGDEMVIEHVRERVEIGPCKLIGFDPYRKSNKYEIEYTVFDQKGRPSLDTTWVNADELELPSDSVDEIIAE